MTAVPPSERYDEQYFRHQCGTPYDRANPHWLPFFSGIAERIVRGIGPASVLDAGCAKGFLVEALRDRGVEAEGLDISAYAIGEVRADIRPYCRVGSLTEPLPRRYDLIVCIEVLEHLPQPESEQALANLCAASDDILLSSSPDDQREPTHLNVQPPEYWAGLFALHGFWREVEFDASFITPWAMRFRKAAGPAFHTIAAYERKLWRLSKQVATMRETALATRAEVARTEETLQGLTAELAAERAARERRAAEFDAEIASWRGRHEDLTGQLDAARREGRELQGQLLDRARAIDEHVAEKERQLRKLADVLAERARLAGELDAATIERQQLARRLQEIESRLSWQLLHKAWQTQQRVAAPHTPRGRAWLALTRGARAVLPKGLVNGAAPAAGNGTRPALSAPAAPGTDGRGRANTHEDEYAAWIARTAPSSAELDAQRLASSRLASRPLISIVTPVFNPPARILRETIASVRAQTYEHWEWCLVDGGSEGPEIRAILDEVAARDARVRVEFPGHNLGIAGNSNAAAALASGEYIALLDHDDLLAPNALFEVAAAANAHPEADLIYFDEDKLDEGGARRSDPFFKPDWSPELLLSANYLTHSVIRRRLFEEVGGFDPATEGAQDWDLVLRCTERTSAVFHLPKVLYHWRRIAGSTAAAFQAKPYVFDNQLRSVAEHLRRQGIAGAEARFASPGILQVVWPARGTKVSIIIPTKDKLEVLRPCLTSLLELTRYANYEILLVDNNSQGAETLAYYAELAAEPRVRIVAYPHVFNYSAANNLGARHATGELLLFLNNDIEILEHGWLEELARWAERPEIGAVGTKLLYPDGRIQHAGIVVGMEGHASHVFWGVREGHSGPFGSCEWYRDYLAVTGACMMMRRTIFEEVGGFDEGYTLTFSDIEIGLRIAGAGYRNLYTPFARLLHHEGSSRGQHIPVGDLLRGFAQMRDRVAAGDPYYNPNLTYAGRIPALVKPDEEPRAERLRRVSGVANAAVPTLRT